jgi:uncharacterized OB-fold protein
MSIVRDDLLPAATVLSLVLRWATSRSCARRDSGTLHGYVITHRAAPGFEAPYVIAVVELDEGPRLLTNLVGVAPDPEAIALDLPVEVLYEPVGEIVLPMFRPRTT